MISQPPSAPWVLLLQSENTAFADMIMTRMPRS